MKRMVGRSTWVWPTLFAAVVAHAGAQEGVPVFEIGTNYSLLQEHPGGAAPNFTSQGGSMTAVYNATKIVGVVADVGLYTNGSSANLNPLTTTYLFGPRLSLRKFARVTPYAQTLFGGARVSTNQTNSVGNPLSGNGFAAAYGGGMDVIAGKHVTLKPFQLEYATTHTPNLWSSNNIQKSLRYTAGMSFTFGSK